MQNPFLIGERIYLRPIEEADASNYVRWLNDAEVSRYLAASFPLNLFREQEYVRNLYTDRNGLNLALSLQDGDRHIGGAGIHDIHQTDRSATFGIVIGEQDCWGKGYGTEATRLLVAHGFDTLNLNRIGLNVFEFNPRGIRAYEKAGFVKEGLLRQATTRKASTTTPY